MLCRRSLILVTLKKNCKICGGETTIREYRNKTMKTTSGTVVIRRPYLYCKKCKKHNFPKETSALQAGRLSPKLTADVCLLAHQVPFQQASDILERIANVKVSTSTVKVISEQVGKFLFEEKKEKSLANQIRKSCLKRNFRKSVVICKLTEQCCPA